MNERKYIAALLLASLGYFVDIYDLLLFSIVRVQSLKDLGLSGNALMEDGLMLLNVQMVGMLLGGVVFGILGDKKGRLSVLFSSILLYSTANFLNGFVQSVEVYAILRFIAGFGLAGELGAGVTLVSELLPKEKRGYGTTIIATVGVSGAVFAWFVTSHVGWRQSYIIGGCMGFALLFTRMGVIESTLFSKLKLQPHAPKASLLKLFSNKARLKKFIACIAIGTPLWYVIGLLVTLSPEFAKVIGVQGEVEAGKVVLWCYSGQIVGDLSSGLISQYFKSRRKSIALFLSMTLATILMYFFMTELTLTQFHFLCFTMGIAIGYWAMFVAISAEQFGTNIRATVATSAPNFVRGAVVPITALFAFFRDYMDLWSSGLAVGVIVMTFAFWGYWNIDETFHQDMDFLEE
jgi:MFS family permease